MTYCGLREITQCGNDATRRVVWDMVIDHADILYLCDDCTRKYDAAIIDGLGPIDPRDIPAEYRSRTLNRFLPKIDWESVDDIVEDCWEWTASTTSGYAQFRWRGVGYGHRYSFRRFWFVDPPERHDDDELLHDCNQKTCCNPIHLYLGTGSQNMNHAVETGLIDTGSAITELEREGIRERYETESETTQVDLADDYGYSQTVIFEIIHERYIPAR